MLPSPLFDLPALSRFFFTAVLLFAGAFFILRRAASRFFFVGDDPASFVAEETRRSPMAVAGGLCAACGEPGTKKCSRCKSVLYCSQVCQAKHWGADHKQKCKQIASSNDVSLITGIHKRKSSGVSSISLVPPRGTCKLLQESKKILFPYDEFVKLFDWDKPGFPPCGLLNCGNSCFANVVLQCLACTRPLTAYLLEKDHSRGCIRKRDDWCFLCELQIHIQRASESPHPFSPLNILSRLPNIGGNLGCGRQEDAHEFMRFVIDTMQSICLDEFGGEKALDMSSQETTLIQHIFGGQLLSQVVCTKCNTISNRYENMMDLTVEIQGDAEYLEECLDQFTAEEWLDGDNKYKCDGCNDYVKACKRLTVHRAPNILTITLKRFQSGRFGKLNKRVAFPENLDLTPYMSGNRDGTDVYTLYAVVVHVDMLNASFFGHYICYTKGYCGRWYRIDDCKVMNADVDEVLSQGAYMLLYRRKNVRPEPLAKPLEEPVKKNSAEVDPMSCTTKGADDVHELAYIGSQPSMPSHGITCDASLLGDAGYENVLPGKIDNREVEEPEGVAVNVLINDNRQAVNKDVTAIQTDNPISRLSGVEEVNTTKVNKLESADLHVSIEDHKQLVHDYTPNLQIDCSNLSWLGMENLEEKIDALHSKFIQSDSVSSVKVPFTSVQAMDLQEHCGITDAACHKKYNGSIGILEKSTTDSSICSHNIIPETAKSYSTCSSTSVPVQQLSYDSIPKRMETEVGILLPNCKDAATEAKTLLSYVENGSNGKPKPMLANGFLDRINKRNSEVPDSRVKVGNFGTAVADKVTDCSQRDSVTNIAQQSAHDDCIGLPSLSAIDNGTISRLDLPCISKVSLTSSHEKPLYKDKILIEDVVCNGHPCKADYIRLPDLVSPCLNGNVDLGVAHSLDNIVRNQPEKSCEELANNNLETEEKPSGQGFHGCDSSRTSFPDNSSIAVAKSDLLIPGSFLALPLSKKPLNVDETCRKDSDEACYSCSSDYYGYAEHSLHQNSNGNSGLDTSHLNGLSAQFSFCEDLHEHKSQELGHKTEIETKETADAASAYGPGLMSENYSNNA